MLFRSNDLQFRSQNPKPYTTPGSKGKKYTREKSDDRKSAGRKKSMLGSLNQELGKNTDRNIFKGASDLQQLSKGIFESQDTNYAIETKEEDAMLENNVSIKRLIKNLEEKDDK